jgi:hypothetical protein
MHYVFIIPFIYLVIQMIHYDELQINFVNFV